MLRFEPHVFNMFVCCVCSVVHHLTYSLVFFGKSFICKKCWACLAVLVLLFIFSVVLSVVVVAIVVVVFFFWGGGGGGGVLFFMLS